MAWAGVYRAGGIGDSLIVSSAVAQLAKSYQVEVLCETPWGCMWENNPHVSRLTQFPENHLPKDQREWQTWHIQKAKEFEANGGRYFNLSHSVEVLCAYQTIQSSFYWPASFRRQVCNRNYLEVTHDICEVPHDFNPGPRFYPTNEELERAKERRAKLDGKVVGIQLSGSRLDKVWPYLPQTVAMLLRETDCHVLMFGAPGREMDIANQVSEIAQMMNGNVDRLHSCISREGKDDWRLREALTMIGECDLVIGPDTGPMWSVAMEDVPKIVLLSHASPENITKHWHRTLSLTADPERVSCAPCHLLHDQPDTCRKAENANAAACMADISSEVVLAAAKAALA